MSTKLLLKFFYLITLLSFYKIMEGDRYFVRSMKPYQKNNDGNDVFEMEMAADMSYENKLKWQTNWIKFLHSNLAALMLEMKELKSSLHETNESEGFLKSGKPVNILTVTCADKADALPQNCHDLMECHPNIYHISIPKFAEPIFPVSCDLQTADGGWTVIQRRLDGSENFNRNWTEYVKGFGNLNGEFFIGLDKLHALTTLSGPQELYIILKDFEGEQRIAQYSTFQVDSKEKDYQLTVGNYSGNAGDSFSPHSGSKFSTWDRDNDQSVKNCAKNTQSGWWFHSCYSSNLNGKYAMGKITSTTHGLGWGEFRGLYYSLKFSQMMIRPRPTM